MALPKATTAKAEVKKPEAPVKVDSALELKEPEIKQPEVKAKPTMQKFLLVKGQRLLQPSTGIMLVRGKVTELKDDSWVKFQVEAGLVETVE